MIMQYTHDMFEDDKKKVLDWLEKNWQYDDFEIGNFLQQLIKIFKLLKENQEPLK